MPVLPQLHHGQPQRLLLTRQRPGDARILTLRLWESGYYNPQDGTTLWIGNTSLLRLEDRFWLLRFLRTDTDFNTPLQQLEADLDTFSVRKVQRHTTEEEVADIDWDGSVLLVSPDRISE